MERNAKLFLIDGSALAYRSYFGMIRTRLSTSAGEPTGAIYAFINALQRLLKEEQPDYIGMVFDAPEKTFRHQIFPEYKATREAMPEDLVGQLPKMFELTEALRIPVIVKPGYEADDIIGTMAKQARERDLAVYMVTGDKDFMQLLEQDVCMYKPASGSKPVEIFSAEDVVKKWGVRADQITDYLGLIGDSSDNIPGIKGIGPAKAVPLLQRWDTLEEILDHIDSVESPRVAKLLQEGAESARFSKKLATICTDVPVEVDLDQLRVDTPDEEQLQQLFKELEFHSLLKEPGKTSKAKKREKRYRCLKTVAEIQKLHKPLKKADILSVDLETTSLNPMRAEIVGISLSWQADEAVYIPLRTPAQQANMFGETGSKELLATVQPILEDAEIPKCGQNLKYDMLILRQHGIELQGLDFDTMVAAFLIEPDMRSYKLDILSQRYLDYQMQPIEELIGSGKKQIRMDEVDLDKVVFYACEDADVVLQLLPIFRKRLKQDEVWSVFREIEMPLVTVLLQMEQNGVYLDTAFLENMSAELGKQIDQMAAKIHDIAGEEFNINSPKQLAGILFDKLDLPTGRKRSTAVDVLEKLKSKHPLPGMILDYRALVKLKNTYLDTLPTLVHTGTKRVHGSFNQTVASTGRLSSSDPNFQNIPIRTEIGRRIRHAFVPQKPGWKLISADYSQIELRIMAHLSMDSELVKAFEENVDIHSRTAALVYGVPEGEVLADMRRVAKVVNFGIMYGAGAYRISSELGISMAEARQLIDQYFKTYPGINQYIIRTLESARKDGFVKTLSGRRRYIADINSANRNIREAAERAAINMPIQGTAADMIKIAMIRIHAKLQKEKLRSLMILQIHDELLFESPSDEVDAVVSLIRGEMEEALPLRIPIKVDIGIGNSWFEAH